MPRLLQGRPRRPPGGDTGTTAESPAARCSETRARPETTRPCTVIAIRELHWLPIMQRIEYKLSHRVGLQGPDLSGA